MLLAYRQSRLAASECSHISRHLAACDFCSAELQLLGLYHENREDYVLPDMPVEVRVLAERLLGHSQTHFHTASEFFPA